jgi:DNA-binding response OmpR family regulator
MITEPLPTKYRPFHGAWSPLTIGAKTPPRIVVADDEPHLLRLLQHKLERAGYEVWTARDGQIALDLAYEWDPDLCLLDVMMPRRDGWDVLRELRAGITGREVKVIMLTALAGDRDITKGFDLGADAYLTKPFRPGTLLTQIRAHL